MVGLAFRHSDFSIIEDEDVVLKGLTVTAPAQPFGVPKRLPPLAWSLAGVISIQKLKPSLRLLRPQLHSFKPGAVLNSCELLKVRLTFIHDWLPLANGTRQLLKRTSKARRVQ